jgi:hypothetical protein
MDEEKSRSVAHVFKAGRKVPSLTHGLTKVTNRTRQSIVLDFIADIFSPSYFFRSGRDQLVLCPLQNCLRHISLHSEALARGAEQVGWDRIMEEEIEELYNQEITSHDQSLKAQQPGGMVGRTGIRRTTDVSAITALLYWP